VPSPFPGMDPYLEDPTYWSDIHHELIHHLRAYLNPRLGKRYFAHLESRVYVEFEEDWTRKVRIPDVRDLLDRHPGVRSAAKSTVLELPEPIVAELPETRNEEAYIAIKDLKSGLLVTIIEVLSPSNKIESSAGGESFLDKRTEVLSSTVHWVEIDLLRDGERWPSTGKFINSDYRVLVSRSGGLRKAKFWPTSVRQRLPIIGVPLKEKDEEVSLDLGEVLGMTYEIAGYSRRLDYTKPPSPPLRPADAKWANALLRTKGLR